MTTKHGVGVWCHLCMVKSFCHYAHSQSCWNINQLVFYKNVKVVREGDFERQRESTIKCPLLIVFTEAQSQMEMIRR